MIVELTKKWVLGGRLAADAGGFGAVFEARGEGGESAVVKFVDKVAGAERELLFGAVEAMQGVANVVPIWDSGEHNDQLALVMPRADKSLRQHLTQAVGPLEIDEAVDILSDIAAALVGIADIAVHRDVKPENVLLLEGNWCLADFGIARYADASTDPETRKASFTKPYAAPEQWRHEHATSATDIYAFGVTAYELLTGVRPFAGPDFRNQHLHSPAPEMTVGTPRLRVLVEECLLKAPGARPTAELVVEKLRSALNTRQSAGALRLAALNRSAVRAKAAQHAAMQSAATEAERRIALAEAATLAFSSISEQLRTIVEEDAGEAHVVEYVGGGPTDWAASLGQGTMGVGQVISFDASPWDGPFDVVAMSEVYVTQSPTAPYFGRHHSLWFCDPAKEGQYAWFEIAFMNFASNAQPRTVPFSLTPGSAAVAFSRGVGNIQVAWGPHLLDRADLEEFVDRWIGWFADAGEGQMGRPSHLPEPKARGKWRVD